jgi:hypothetical protein
MQRPIVGSQVRLTLLLRVQRANLRSTCKIEGQRSCDRDRDDLHSEADNDCHFPLFSLTPVWITVFYQTKH